MEKSLLAFVSERLSQDVSLIIGDTPVFGVQVNDDEFEARFLDRGALLHRVRTDRALVALIIEAMSTEQGPPPVDATTFTGGPITSLGSELLKLIAARYSSHSDWRPEWAPGVELPAL